MMLREKRYALILIELFMCYSHPMHLWQKMIAFNVALRFFCIVHIGARVTGTPMCLAVGLTFPSWRPQLRKIKES